MNDVIHSVIVRRDGKEHVCLVETQDDKDALNSVLAVTEGITEDDCEVLRLVLAAGAALPIGFFWQKVVWLDDWGPDVPNP
jgi:hypothetical protein